MNTTSRLRYGIEHLTHLTVNEVVFSPYLASGIISARACVRATMELFKSKNVDGNRDNGVGMWVQEIGY